MKPDEISGPPVLSDVSTRMLKTFRAVHVRVMSYLTGLFWLWFDADEDIQLLHECCDTLGLHFNVFFNIKH